MDEFFLAMQPEDLKKIYRSRITKDFVPGEYAPYFVLHRQLREGIQKGLFLCAGDRVVAYAIYADKQEYVLLSLMAVSCACRGVGYGTKLLREIIRLNDHKRGILTEVERPEDAKNPEEEKLRRKRMAFYERAGFYAVKDIDYSIWGIPMHLMFCPQPDFAPADTDELARAMHEIYLTLMGRTFIHKMVMRIRGK